MLIGERASRIYRHRFSQTEREARALTWRHLCQGFFQRYVRPTDVVVDVGAGDGLFIRNIRAGRRIAIDTNPDLERLAEEGIETRLCSAADLPPDLEGCADVVFMSNFLEHLPTRQSVVEVLEGCRRLLRPGGLLLVLQPNLRYVGAAYWDFIDHHVGLTEKSLAEALTVAGFDVEELIPRFVPYTSKSRLAALAPLTRVYLRVPLLWQVFGQQAFAVARAPRS